MVWLCMSIMLVLFFKQKTAYEMRISDWSSDVCSSELRTAPVADLQAQALHLGLRREIARPFPDGDGDMNLVVLRRDAHHLGTAPGHRPHIAARHLVGGHSRPGDRKSVV